MTNVGVLIIGLFLTVSALIAGYVNSFMVMEMIGATTMMWVLWVISLTGVIIGGILLKLGE
jgi:hypothetical protein